MLEQQNMKRDIKSKEGKLFWEVIALHVLNCQRGDTATRAPESLLPQMSAPASSPQAQTRYTFFFLLPAHLPGVPHIART